MADISKITAIDGSTYNLKDSSARSDISALQTAMSGKQGTLTAGTNINIDSNNVISATGGGGTSFKPTSISFGNNQVTETAADGTKVTTFNADGSITEVLTITGSSVETATTTFNADGTITITYS